MVICSRKETFCLRLRLSFFLWKSGLTFNLAKQRQRHPAAVVSEAWLGALELYRWRSGLQLLVGGGGFHLCHNYSTTHLEGQG